MSAPSSSVRGRSSGSTDCGRWRCSAAPETGAVLRRDRRERLNDHHHQHRPRPRALDGVQRSTRYPGGVALRFARVKGYRADKDAADADTIDDLRALLPRG